MEKIYYKVVKEHDDGKLTSCCAGNKDGYGMIFDKIIRLEPQTYKIGEYVHNYKSPMMVFNSEMSARLFLYRMWCTHNIKVYTCEIVPETNIKIKHVCGWSFSRNTVFAKSVKLLHQVKV